MCADLAYLYEEIKKLEQAGVDWLHIDIMDGHFVPNFTFGPDIVKKVREITSLPLDIHLMVEEPERYIDIWQPTSKDIISFHIEAKSKPEEVIEQIKTKQSRPALALNPQSPIEAVVPFLTSLDMILLMTVNPGFAGQKWIPEVLDKVGQLKKLAQEKNLAIDIQVDGNIGEHNIALLQKAGANIFVAGSASVFASRDYLSNVSKMHTWLEGGRKKGE